MNLIKYNPFSGIDRFFSGFDIDHVWVDELSNFEGITKSLKDNVLTYQIALPKKVDLEQLKAEVRDGLVTISVPLKEKQSKKVKIEQK